MKPAAVIAVVTILTILVIAEVIALADTNDFPPVVSAPVPNNINLQVLPSQTLKPGRALPPGIYQTAPFAIALKVPELTGDNCVIHNQTPLPMPERHPQLKILPGTEQVSEAKK